MTDAQLFADAVERKFGSIDQHQSRWLETCDLAAEFGTDGTTCSRNQHDVASQQIVYAIVIQRNSFSPQQILQFDFANAGYRQPPGQQIVVRGHRQDCQPCRRSQFCSPSPLGRPGIRHGYDGMFGAQALRN